MAPATEQTGATLSAAYRMMAGGRTLAVHRNRLILFGRLRAPQLHPIQRARSRQRIRPVTHPRPLLTRQVLTAHRQRERAVGAQPVMVGEILIAECQSHHALRDQVLDRVFRPRLVTVIDKALRDPLGHTQDTVRLPQERRPRVGCQPSAIESACNLTSTRVLKYEPVCCTLCHDGSRSTVKGNSL